MSSRILLLFLFLFSFCSCKKKKAEHSFYYWNSRINIDSAGKDKIKKLGANHFYLHFFDVDWSEATGMPVPKAEISTYLGEAGIDSNYTPVVFITNRTFQHLSEKDCELLASRIAKRVSTIVEGINTYYISRRIYKLNIPYDGDYEKTKDSVAADILKERMNQLTEIQIDCDWTASTKDRYFHFLRAFKKQFPDKAISATIRLYPYKYQTKEGVPPVDKGMLMCYNLGGINNISTGNSVFSEQELKKYLTVDYPLPLDIAFPVFGWYVWFRGSEYKGIIHDNEDIENYAKSLPQKDNTCRIPVDTVIGDSYFREGDMLRIEFPDEAELDKSIDLVTGHIGKFGRIAFYHWGSPSIKKYERIIQNTFDHY